MVYKDILTMLVRDMQADVVAMREVKLKFLLLERYHVFGGGSYSSLFLNSFMLLFTQFYWWVTKMVHRDVLKVLVREMYY